MKKILGFRTKHRHVSTHTSACISTNIKSYQKFISIALMVLVILLSHDGLTKETNPGKLLSIYQIQLDDFENFITSHARHYQMGILTSRKGKILLVAQDYAPQSISSVKNRALEDGVLANAIRVIKWKDRALFHYETADQVHVYSTMGGHLLISKKTHFKLDLKKLGLTKQDKKKVVRL